MYIDPAKFLDLVTFSAEGITKAVTFDLDTAQDGAGTFIASITGVTNANQGLPDYWVDVALSGMTFPENDLNKETILTMHAETIAAVQSFTPAQLTTALGLTEPAAIVGIINIESSFSYDGSTNIYRVQFRLAVTDLDFATVSGTTITPLP